MAEIVGALGVPHTPFFPSLVEREGPQCETARFFAAVTRELEAMRPDLIVMYDTDHLNTFFLDNLPVFAVGVTERVQGAERRAALGADLHHQVAAGRRRPSAARLRRRRLRPRLDPGIHGRSFGGGAAALHDAGHAGAGHSDLRQRAHSAAAVGPSAATSSAPRSSARSRAGRRAARRRHRQRQLLARSVRPAHRARQVGRRARSGLGAARLRADRAGIDADLDQEATQEQMLHAGNVGGELLDWIAMLGAVGERRPKFVTLQMEQGHAYAAWNWS